MLKTSIGGLGNIIQAVAVTQSNRVIHPGLDCYKSRMLLRASLDSSQMIHMLAKLKRYYE
jgi:hypothetical protein